MNQLIRMHLAGMLVAAAACSPTLAGASWRTGAVNVGAIIASSGGVAPGSSFAAVSNESASAPFSAMAGAADEAVPESRVTSTRPRVVLSVAQLASARDWISSELMNCGRDEQFARDAASLLTPDDLAVLAANPKMMQPAGAMSAQFENFLWATLIVGGIVVLIIAADSSTVIISA